VRSQGLPQWVKRIMPALRIYLKEQDVKKIVKASLRRGSPKNFRNQVLVQTLLATAMRRSELAALQVEDIDWDERVIHVWKGKGGKDRITFVDPETLKLLRRYVNGRTSGSVFGIGPHRIYGIVKSMARAASVRNAERISPHKLRHTFSIEWIQRGGDLESLRRILGHSSVATTQRYLDFDDAYLRQAYDRLRSTKQQERRMV